MVYQCLPRVETPEFLSCSAWGAKISRFFSTQPFDDTPFAALMLTCERPNRITRLYPNFLFLGHWGTPSFPPVLRAIRNERRAPLRQDPA
jgi:hypothetical protein